jgi:aspartate carbamoyltransferase catalytic subunit
MYSIKKTQGSLDNINIFMVGDLKYGRTVHSLLMAMSEFENPIFNFIAPPELAMPDEYNGSSKARTYGTMNTLTLPTSFRKPTSFT